LRDDYVGREAADQTRAHHADGIGLVAHVKDLERNSLLAERRLERPAPVKREQPCVDAASAQAGQQNRPVTLDSAGSEVREDEERFHGTV
jgi:hypothetical protein